MKSYVSKTDFIDWFRSSDTYKNNFSYEGLDALFDWLEEYEDGTGQDVEFDPIAICCEFSEYENLQEVKENYSCINDMDDLEMHTSVIPVYNIDGSKSEKLIIVRF